MSTKKLYQVIKEKQVIGVLLATSQEACQDYLISQNIVDSLDYITVLEVAKQNPTEENNVLPLMIAKKFTWYDLRHYRNLYIYEEI